MKKLIYYLRILLFIVYLVILFLLIDTIYRPNFFATLFFILNLIYSFLMILTILSKKEIFKNTISYNILNIGVSLYTILLYIISSSNTPLDVINNEIYYRNNFIMIGILLIGLIGYSLGLNKENKNDEN